MIRVPAERHRINHILVVEDDSSIAEILLWILTDAGYHVTCAASLEEARQACRERTPDAIIADLLLPDGVGSDLLQEVPQTRDGRQPPSLIMSALPQAQALAYAAGATLCLTKPFDLSDLLDAVKRLTQRSPVAGFNSGSSQAS